MDDMLYVRLDVVFERDMDTVALPLLGQAGFMGALQALVGENVILPFLDVIPADELFTRMRRELRNGSLEDALDAIPAPNPQKWFSASDGWKAASRIRAALLAPASVKRAGLETFEEEMAEETDRLMACLERADGDNIRFRLSFEESADATVSQARWVVKELGGVASAIRAAFTEAGINHSP